MTLERLQNYFAASLPLALDAPQRFRLLRSVFILVFVSAVIIHLLTQTNTGLSATLLHATTIGLIYAFAVGLASALLFLLRDTVEQLQVWHIWAMSVAGFFMGYYVLPLDDVAMWLISRDVAHHGEPLGFVQLLPVWFLVTHLFLQPYLSEGLKAELERLREVNSLLDHRDPNHQAAKEQTVLFESGRKSFRLKATRIRNIAVEDHYCYVHYEHESGFAKHDLAMPLRDVLALVPKTFVQVHRSHIVNMVHVRSVRRKGRNTRLLLDNGFEVPVSRHRLDDVLPVLRQQATPATDGTAPRETSTRT